MEPIELRALVGTNPLGFLAALGVLYSTDMQTPDDGAPAKLSWTDDVQPRALLWGIGDEGELLDRLEAERDAVAACTALNWPSKAPLATAKPDRFTLRAWAQACYDDADPRSADVFNALVAEGAYSGKGEAKPTHLDFTAGQQRLLVMVRQLAQASDRARLTEALQDWRFGAEHPSLAFDPGDERLYALRPINPSNEKRASAPGANWLAFLGLMLLPVVNEAGALRTVGCGRPWKRSSMTWALSDSPMSCSATAALLRGGGAFFPTATSVSATIRRTDQGGYGSFSGVVIGRRESREAKNNPLLRLP